MDLHQQLFIAEEKLNDLDAMRAELREHIARLKLLIAIFSELPPH
jgi:hypothetical protein